MTETLNTTVDGKYRLVVHYNVAYHPWAYSLLDEDDNEYPLEMIDELDWQGSTFRSDREWINDGTEDPLAYLEERPFDHYHDDDLSTYHSLSLWAANSYMQM